MTPFAQECVYDSDEAWWSTSSGDAYYKVVDRRHMFISFFASARVALANWRKACIKSISNAV